MGEPGRRSGLDRVLRVGFAGAALPFVGIAVAAWPGIADGASGLQIAVYGLLPIGITAALVWIAWMAPTALRVNLLLLAGSLGFGLYLAETVLSLRGRTNVGRQVAEAAGKSWDPRSRLEMILDLRAEGRRAYPFQSGEALQRVRIALSGERVQPLTPAVSEATVVLCNEAGVHITYESDSHGFNNPPGAWERDPPVVLIGDSYVHGTCVPASEQVATQLRARWPNLLNLAVSGAGPLMELGILREFAGIPRPPIVIWVFYEGNDLHDLAMEGTNPILPRYLDPRYSQRLAERQDEIDEALAGWVDSLIGVADFAAGGPPRGVSLDRRLREAAKLTIVRRMAGFGVRFPTRGSAIGMLPEIFRQAHTTVDGWGGTMYLVYLPTYRRYYQRIGQSVSGRDEVLQAAAEIGVEVIDLDPVFRAQGDPKSLWIHPEGHLNSRGYALMAETILDAIPAGANRP